MYVYIYIHIYIHIHLHIYIYILNIYYIQIYKYYSTKFVSFRQILYLLHYCNVNCQLL